MLSTCNCSDGQLPRFRWVPQSERSADPGVQLLSITYPDSITEDYAHLKPSFDNFNCLYQGYLEHENDVFVSLNGCPYENTFDVRKLRNKKII